MSEGNTKNNNSNKITGQDDKTRLANGKTAKASNQGTDKTRIAPSRTAKLSNQHNEKTRIAPAGTAKVDVQQSDKTRIAPASSGKTSARQDDRTRVAPAKTEKVAARQSDKTRLVPRKKNTRQISPENDEVAVTQPDHGSAKHVQRTDPTRVANRPVQHTLDKVETTPPTIPDNQIDSGSVQTDLECPADQLSLEPVDISQMGDHGVLKKRFILESVLGAGGMGIVYKAKDRLKVEAQDRDPYVAIKVLSEEFKSHPEAFISLQRESRKSQRIAHPNIVNVHDFDRDGDTVFMTMEYLDGEPLDQLIRRYKSTGLPTEDCWSIIKGMCAALSHAHAEKIIHSDFKPGNVFVTSKGIAKVFDFGIARAVAKVEQVEGHSDDKTVFDAGNLGALTPAYASLEMLQGKEPDIRDDIFALGCVAYEMFTAQHPYNRTPADEAMKQGLKPKKIANISKKQWRAIEKAIAFRRQDRTVSIDQFLDDISPKKRATNLLGTTLAILLPVAITVYFVYFQQKPPAEPAFSEDDITLKVKMDILQQDIQLLIDKPLFSNAWQESVWLKLSELQGLSKQETPWVTEKKQQIYTLYMGQIKSQISSGNFTVASELISHARRFSQQTEDLEIQSSALEKAIQQQKADQAAAAEKERSRQKLLTKKRQQEKLAKQKLKQSMQKKKKQKTQDTKIFDAALENVNNQLKCINRLNMKNIETAVNKLREVDKTRYQGVEKNIVNALASCLKQTGRLSPERAEQARKYSLRIFKDNPLLAGITIKARDVCDRSLAGLGSRGKRAMCRDKLKNAGHGPELVVIPASSRIDVFAIGKYEVSIEEINKYCKLTSYCKPVTAKNLALPVTGIDISLVKGYLAWLSDESGKTYRLPSRKEWTYAAKSRRKSLDANRNCKISTRGIQKGEGLIINSIGKQNGWGLVNYVGNAQEWVYDKGKKLKAMGGSYAQSLENCDITTVISHNGSADELTGFRVLREVSKSL